MDAVMIGTGVLEQGMIYAVMALGIYITYKILDFPDLTVDGSFPLGAAVTAALLLRGVNPYLTLPVSFASGCLAGMVTGLIHVKFKVRDLLSGIIMMTALYTVNLRIAGKANLPIFNQNTIFQNTFLDNIFPQKLEQFQPLFIILMVTLAVKILLDLYLKTKSGYLLRAAGDNERIVISLAKDSGMVKILGLAIANGLVSLSGSVYCQQQRFFDSSMGTGTMVIGLASVIIGTNICKGASFIKTTTAVIFGSVIYKACVAAALSLGFPATDMKLITAVLFFAILVIFMDRRTRAKAGVQPKGEEK